MANLRSQNQALIPCLSLIRLTIPSHYYTIILVDELRNLITNKRGIANLLVLGILVLSLPLGIRLIRQQQIFSSKAATQNVVIGGAGVQTRSDGKKVTASTSIQVTLYAPPFSNLAQSPDVTWPNLGMGQAVSPAKAADCDPNDPSTWNPESIYSACVDSDQGKAAPIYECPGGGWPNNEPLYKPGEEFANLACGFAAQTECWANGGENNGDVTAHQNQADQWCNDRHPDLVAISAKPLTCDPNNWGVGDGCQTTPLPPGQQPGQQPGEQPGGNSCGGNGQSCCRNGEIGGSLCRDQSPNLFCQSDNYCRPNSTTIQPGDGQKPPSGGKKGAGEACSNDNDCNTGFHCAVPGASAKSQNLTAQAASVVSKVAQVVTRTAYAATCGNGSCEWAAGENNGNCAQDCPPGDFSHGQAPSGSFPTNNPPQTSGSTNNNGSQSSSSSNNQCNPRPCGGDGLACCMRNGQPNCANGGDGSLCDDGLGCGSDGLCRKGGGGNTSGGNTSGSTGKVCIANGTTGNPPGGKPAGPSVPTKFTHFKIANNASNVDSAAEQSFEGDGMQINFNFADFKDTTPGPKQVVVKFIAKDSSGKVVATSSPRYDYVILLGPPPVISTADCASTLTQSDNAPLTFTVTGAHFGAGGGSVKIDNSTINITSGTWKDNMISVVKNTSVAASHNIDVTTADGQTVSAGCQANTSQVQFKVSTACRPDGTVAANKADVRIADKATGVVVETESADVGPDGSIKLQPKLSKGKKYSLWIKAPGSLASKVDDFTATDGTTKLRNLGLRWGDICPAPAGDGKTNSVDKTCMNQQWVSSVDAQNRTADCNGDNRVNTVDWSFMRQNFNATDQNL